MKVEKYISDLLYSNDCVVVVNFGGFILNAKDAIIDGELSIFKPPRKEVAFNSLLRNDDGVLVSYIASKENISYDDARKKVEDFARSIKDKLEVFEPVYLAKLGLFEMNIDKTINFTAALDINYNAESFGLSNFIMPAINENNINTFGNNNMKTIPLKILKYAASIAAIFALGFIFFTVADHGLQNMYQASFLPMKDTTHSNIQVADTIKTIDVAGEENALETSAEEMDNQVVEEEVIETVIESAAEEAVVETVVEEVPKTIASTVKVTSDLVLTNGGAKLPFVIVASCADYAGARKVVTRLQNQGYANAAIIHSDKRYRVTVSSQTTENNHDAVWQDAKAKVTANAWVLYY